MKNISSFRRSIKLVQVYAFILKVLILSQKLAKIRPFYALIDGLDGFNSIDYKKLFSIAHGEYMNQPVQIILSFDSIYGFGYTLINYVRIRQDKPDHITKMTELTLQDFKKRFPNDDVCIEWLRSKLYPEKIFCDACQAPTFHHKIKSRKTFECDRCGAQMSPTTGTIFYKSSTPLTIWFYVIYKMAQTRNGISAKQIQRETAVTYKTAWRMCKEIKKRLGDNNFSAIHGNIELAENYFIGK